jgi:hypothetical protein
VAGVERPIARRHTFACLILVALAGLVAGCGSTRHSRPPAARPAGEAPVATAVSAPEPRLRLVATRALPAPVQLPALAVRGGRLLALGGLDAADASVAGVVRVAPGRARMEATLPQAVHDAGAAALGGRVYVFGGGTPAGPTADIVALGSGVAGRLPAPSSDLEAVRAGAQILVVGGYDGVRPLRSVLGFRPGQPVRLVATLPHPLRYAAAATDGHVVLVAGGTDGVHARREVLRIDPATRRVTRIGRLPQPLAHAAAAVLDGTLYVFGGRGDGAGSARRTIWAIDPATGRTRRAGLLPLALSDLSAATLGRRLLVVGGRGADGHVADRVLEYTVR